MKVSLGVKEHCSSCTWPSWPSDAFGGTIQKRVQGCNRARHIKIPNEELPPLCTHSQVAGGVLPDSPCHYSGLLGHVRLHAGKCAQKLPLHLRNGADNITPIRKHSGPVLHVDAQAAVGVQ